jgi:hypothetical protein
VRTVLRHTNVFCVLFCMWKENRKARNMVHVFIHYGIYRLVGIY